MKNLKKAILLLMAINWIGTINAQVAPDDCDGYSENCLNFDGTSITVGDHVTMGDVLDMGTSDFTLEAWIYVESNSHAMCIINKGLTSTGSPSNAGYQLRVHSTQNLLEFRIYGTSIFTETATYNYLNSWHHVAATKSSTELIIYIDGVAQGSPASVTGNPNLNTDRELTLGAMNKTNGEFYFFDGNIDEVRIWDVERTAAEIAASYDEYLCSIPDHLIAYYHMNENTAGGTNTGQTTVTDFAGSNDGTATNFAMTGATSNWVTGYDLNNASNANLDYTYYVQGSSLYANTTSYSGHQWVECPSTNIASATNTSYTPGSTNTYSLTVTDGCCSATDPCCVDFHYVSPKPIAPTGFGATLDDADQAMKVYPNPVKDNIQLNFNPEDNIKEAKVVVYDTWGRQVLSFDNVENRIESLDLSSLHPGAYILTVVFPMGERSYKFVKD